MQYRNDRDPLAFSLNASSSTLACGSRWLVGSSSSTSFGDWASTRASAARCRSPPDNAESERVQLLQSRIVNRPGYDAFMFAP